MSDHRHHFAAKCGGVYRTVVLAEHYDALRAEVDALREALREVQSVIELDTKEIVRDLVNRDSGLANGAHPNDVYGSLERIEQVILSAMESGQ